MCGKNHKYFIIHKIWPYIRTVKTEKKTGFKPYEDLGVGEVVGIHFIHPLLNKSTRPLPETLNTNLQRAPNVDFLYLEGLAVDQNVADLYWSCSIGIEYL